MGDNHMSVKNNPRVVWVELLRILACLIVIGRHVFANSAKSDSFSYALIWSLVSDGVTIFWFISGFFLYGEKFSYKSKLKHLLTGIIIPMVIFNVFSIGLDHLTSGKPLFCTDDIFTELYCLLTFNQPIRCFHLWFLNIYILLIICSPLINAAVSYLDTNRKRENIFLAITASLLFINDLTLNSAMNFSFHGAGGLIPAVLLTICGHIIYRRLPEAKTEYAAAGAIGVIFINIVRSLMQITLARSSPDYEDHILFWYALPSVFAAICLTVAVSRIRFSDTGKVSSAIRFLSSLTLYIYLTHFVIIEILDNTGVTQRIKDIFLNKDYSIFAGYGLYTLTESIAVFILTAALSLLIKMAAGAVRASIRRCFSHT